VKSNLYKQTNKRISIMSLSPLLQHINETITSIEESKMKEKMKDKKESEKEDKIDKLKGKKESKKEDKMDNETD